MNSEVADIEELYRRHTARKVGFILILAALLIALIIGVVPLGSASLSIGDAFNVIASKLPFGDAECSRSHNAIVWKIRLPRIIMAVVCGMGLAIAGAVMQGIWGNPLASPFTLGVSSAAAFGGMIAGMLLDVSMTSMVGITEKAGVAFLGGLAAVLLIYGFSRRREMSPETALLCGIGLMYFFLVVSFVLALMGGDMMGVLLLTGSLTESTWETVRIALIFLTIPFILLLRYSWKLNAMALGDEVAQSVGINLKRLRTICLLLSTLIIAGIVCTTGVIGFICLISPFVARAVVGNDHRFIFPCSALMGAILLLGMDTLTRMMIKPMEAPVGMLTTIIGVPLFLYLVLQRRQVE
jgi:iron complex transport system permease protein